MNGEFKSLENKKIQLEVVHHSSNEWFANLYSINKKRN